MREFSGSNLWSAFSRSLSVNADREAIVCGGERWTYKEVAAAVAAATTRLAEAGVRVGDRVLLLTENGPTFPVHDLAIAALGAVKVPLNAQLTAGEVAAIGERVQPRAIVLSPSLVELSTALTSTTVRLDATLVKERTADVAGDPAPPPPVGADDPAVIYFTGGTTGQPKGIVHTQSGVLHNLWSHLIESGIGRDDKVLVSTPLPHAAGLFTLTSLLRGATVHIEPRFDPDRVIDVISDEGITWTFAVPTMIYRLLDAADRRGWRPSTLRTIQYGAAPISAERLRQALDRFGPVLQQLYAQTECPNFATVLRKEDHVAALERPELLGSCGKATVMCDVAVLDEDGNEVDAGVVGEVAVDSPYVMDTYWQDPDAAAERFAGRWLRTGDIGYLDEQSYLYLMDRRNDMVVTGGMNVYSIEVEQVIERHPGVAMAAVIGVPHDDWGEAVEALVVPVEGFDAVDEIHDLCRSELAAYKRPKSIELVKELPLTRYGKIDKKALRASRWEGSARAVN